MAEGGRSRGRGASSDDGIVRRLLQARAATAAAYHALGKTAAEQAKLSRERARLALTVARCADEEAALEVSPGLVTVRKAEAELYRRASEIYRSEGNTLDGEARRAFTQAVTRRGRRVVLSAGAQAMGHRPRKAVKRRPTRSPR